MTWEMFRRFQSLLFISLIPPGPWGSKHTMRPSRTQHAILAYRTSLRSHGGNSAFVQEQGLCNSVYLPSVLICCMKTVQRYDRLAGEELVWLTVGSLREKEGEGGRLKPWRSCPMLCGFVMTGTDAQAFEMNQWHHLPMTTSHQIDKLLHNFI